MTPEQWQRVKDVFAGAMELAPEVRNGYVERACSGDTEVRTEVLEMLGTGESTSWLDEPAAGLLAGPAAAPAIARLDFYEGRTIGPYHILRRIGRGGMGAVYMARRTDGYRKTVAIKLIQPGAEDDGEILRRFQNERQTLGVLDHPNIVRLLDGGATPEGLPFLVMEYVQGRPIDAWCETNGLSVRERLHLFCQICSAVQYVHQNLIVHRDLKPANIIVSEDGTARLLDFGIARLLRPDYLTPNSGLTRTACQPLTPEYASPEQSRGQPITTASDIYSLGVLLFRLLTGRLPYKLEAHTAAELESAVCEREPEMPSRLLSGNVERQYRGHRFAADLDNIIAMALRKEPRNRYGSAGQLQDDLRRHLEGLPVIARKPTFRYRFAKFVVRHRTAVLAGAAAVILLLLSSALALRNAYAARRAESRAVQRFNDLRQLANFVIFDLDDAVRAGPTEARRRLIPRALVYLDRLAAESRHDVALQTEVARAYVRVGDLQGNLYGPNLGDSSGAGASYRKALALANTVAAADVIVRATTGLGDLLAADGDRKEALRLYTGTLKSYPGLPPKDRTALLNRAGLVHLQMGDASSAIEVYKRALALAEEQAGPALDPGALRQIAYGRERVAVAVMYSGRPVEAIPLLEHSLALYLKAASAAGQELPTRDTANAKLLLGEAWAASGRHAEAVHAFSEGLEWTRRLESRDPTNTQYLHDEYLALGRLAASQLAAGDRDGARASTQQCFRILRPPVAEENASVYDLHQFAWSLLTTPFADMQDPRSALRAARRAAAKTSRSDPAVLDLLARAQSANGDHALAAATESEALRLAPGPSSLRTELESNLARFQSLVRPPASGQSSERK